MLLRKKIEKLNKSFFKGFPPEDLAVLQRGIAHWVHSKIDENAIRSGAAIPFFTLPDSKDDLCDIAFRLQKGPLILSFYRGRWCPYCNLELRAYDDVVDAIEDHGASIVAVSPQTVDHTRQTAKMNDLEYDLLSDAGNRVARSFGLVFEVPDDMKNVYRRHGMQLPAFNGDDSWELPIPATFVIDSEGKVAGRFVNADYSKRAEPSDVVALIEEL